MKVWNRGIFLYTFEMLIYLQTKWLYEYNMSISEWKKVADPAYVRHVYVCYTLLHMFCRFVYFANKWILSNFCVLMRMWYFSKFNRFNKTTNLYQTCTNKMTGTLSRMMASVLHHIFCSKHVADWQISGSYWILLLFSRPWMALVIIIYLQVLWFYHM